MKTRRLLIGLMLSLYWFNIAHGQAYFPYQSNTRPENPALQLTMKIISGEYCAGDADLDSLRLKVRLVYTNTGKQPLILYKGSHLISRTMISRNSADAAAKRFEVNSLLTQLSSGGRNCYSGAIPSKCFVTLSPGKSFEVEAVAGVFVVRGDAREITGAVNSGKHVLQVEVTTWHESNKLAKSLRGRWLRHGLLWYEPITSAPAPFIVEKQRKVGTWWSSRS